MTDDEPREENIPEGDMRAEYQKALDEEANNTPAPCCSIKTCFTCRSRHLRACLSTEGYVYWELTEA